MDPVVTTGIFKIGSQFIDKFFPDPTEKAKAQAELARMTADGEIREMEVAMSAILMEAKSKDPWTSRARPSFLYVMYFMICSAVPMGFYYAYDPANAQEVGLGLKVWLDAIPKEMWYLFGAGYLGYTTKRSGDKALLLGQEVKPGLLSRLL